MELYQLRCFVAVADEIHFGRAAHRLAISPASLGRQIRMLEESLGTRLLARTTRNVALTEDGAHLLAEATHILSRADEVAAHFRAERKDRSSVLRVGAIDSAAAGLVPLLLHDFRQNHADIAVQLLEDKSIRLIPKLLSGRLDLAFIRPPDTIDRSLTTRFLFHETAVVAVSTKHPLAERADVTIHDLAEEPLIVPERRSRPHSHDLTIKLFTEAGLQARIAQLADEKQTIVNLVAAQLGLAIVPQWTSRLAVDGVRYLPLKAENGAAMNKLPLSAAWARNVRDPLRDQLLETLNEHIEAYAAQA